MPKDEKIVHDSFTLQFRSTKEGEIEFRMDNKKLDIFGDGYLSTADFHKLRGIVNHGFNHLNKHYIKPNSIAECWTDNRIKAGTILKCTGKSAIYTNITQDKLYVVKSASLTGGFMAEDDIGRVNYQLSNSGKYEVVQY